MPSINYIITCGTSQLDPNKYTNIPGHPFAQEKTRKSYINWHDPNQRRLMPGGWTDNQIEDEKVKTIDRLVEDFKQPGLSNVLGAELSTIKLRRNEHPLNPGEIEYFHIIASETTEGKLAAEILDRTLKKLGMHGEEKITPVTYLRDKLEDSDLARAGLDNLITRLFKALRTDAQNIFVISGGFKSVIPCITLFATMFGLEMVYLFEDSNLLQTYPATNYLHNPANRKKWIADWNDNVYGKNVELAPWLNTLFDTGRSKQEMYT